ncbi:MAG: hypothetical protein Q4C48_01680 [Lachnospiraceae bacterium]|nr:hypothetical protein [Lachnospiraceae bacterium]
MKKSILLCIVFLLLLALTGCNDDSPKGTPREPMGGSGSPGTSPSTVTAEPEKPTPTSCDAEPTKEPSNTPVPTPIVHYFDLETVTPEVIVGAEECRTKWGEPTHSGFILAEPFRLAIWEEDPDWLEQKTCPWTDVCHVYFTTWEDCEFYLYVPGYVSEENDNRWSYMKVSREQFLAFVQSRTRNAEHEGEEGAMQYDDKAPFSVWVENGRIVRMAENYMQ